MSTLSADLKHGIVKPSLNWLLMRRYLPYLQPYRKELIIGLALIPFSVLCAILYPWLIMRIIDQQLIAGEIEGLFWWVGALCGVLLGN